MNQPKVSIIILNWNGKKYLQPCLDSVFKINYSNYNVFFVDNASSDNSVDFVKKRYKDKIKSKKLKIIINDKNYGFAEGNNIAIRKVLKDKKVKYICLLNNDTKVDKNFLIELIKFAEKNPKIGILGSKIYYMNEPNRINFAGGEINMLIGIAKHRGNNEIDIGQYDKPEQTKYITGAVMCIKKEVLKKTGLFYKKFFMYYEDTDLSFRAKRKGYQLWYVPSSKVWHHVGGTLNPAFSNYYDIRNKVWFMKRNVKKLQFLFFILILFFILVFLIFLDIYRSLYLKKQHIRERWKGFYDGVFKTCL